VDRGWIMRYPSWRAALIAALTILVVLASVPAQQPPKAELPPIAPNAARLDQTLGGLDGPGFALAYDESTGILG
jgi:hypothetical protein